MAKQHLGKYLKISMRGDRHESIPVVKSYKLPDLEEEWLRVTAADGSQVVLRTIEITSIHLTEVAVA